MKSQKGCLWISIALMIALCLLAILGYLAYYRLMPPLIVGGRDATRPIVTIFAPQHGAQVVMGSTVVVQAEGTARGSQVVLIQLWADGELVGEQTGAAERLNTSWSWMPLTPGDHTLAVRAYNTRRDAGVAMVRVTAIEAADADRDGVPDQVDTCPDHAGLLQLDGCPPGMAGGTSNNPEAQEVAEAWVGPSEEAGGQVGGAPGGQEQPGPELDTDDDGVADANDQCPDQPGPSENQGCPLEVSGGRPGTVQGGQQRPQFEDSDLPPGQIAIEQNCAICDWLEGQGREYGDIELSGTAVEVEVLSLRTAGGLSNVSCYARLQNPQWEQWGRVPDDQDEFFEPLEGGFWNIADYLGGEHGVVVTVPGGEPLRMDVRCYGRLGDMLTPSLHLGEVTREHGPADWNGQTFTARGQEGGNWFDIQYRICSVPCEEGVIPPPYDLRLIRNEGIVTSYVLSWRWDGDPAMIDGFHIYRDGNLIATEYGADQRYTFLNQNTVEPQCSNEYRFEVRAYKGTQESAPSSPAFSVSRFSCGGRNELEVADVILPTPQRPVLYVALNYWYDGDHGDQVHVFAFPLQGNRLPCWEGCSVEFDDLFSLESGVIEPGHGTISYVAVYYGGTEPMVTDGLRLMMWSEDEHRWFYSRDVPLAVQWYPSGPDLAWSGINIFSFRRQVEGQTLRDLQFVVINRGYARLLWSPSLQIRLGNGQLAMPSDPLGDVVLPPGGRASFVWSVPEEVWLALAPTYQVTLDPHNTIAELDEGNNTFTGAVSRLRITYEEVAFFNHGGEYITLVAPEGISGDYFVGPGGQLLALMPGPSGPWHYGEMLQFKGAVRDDWVDNWGRNDLYMPHEQGWAAPISTDPSAPRWKNLADIFDIIRGGCRERGHINTTESMDVNPNPAITREEICDHLISRGFAPERNWVEVTYLPGTSQRLWFFFYDLDVHYQWWSATYVEEYESICDFYQDIPAAQLQNLPGEFILGSAEQGCIVKVRVEDALHP